MVVAYTAEPALFKDLVSATFMRLLILSIFLVCGTALRGHTPLPSDAFFRRSQIISPTLSPDGNHLAYVGEIKGKSVVIHLNLITNSAEALASGVNIEQLAWKGNERLVCGGGFATASIIDLRTHTLTPMGKGGMLDPVYIGDYADGFPNLLIVHRRESVAVLNLDNGKEQVIEESTDNQPFSLQRSTGYYAFDSSGTVRAYVLKGEKENQLMFKDSAAAKFSVIKSWPIGADVWKPVWVSADAKSITLLARGNEDAVQLQCYDVHAHTLTPVLEAPTSKNIVSIRFSPGRREIAGLNLIGHSYETRWLNSDWEKRQQTINFSFPERNVRIVGRSDDGQVCIVLVSSSHTPSELYVWNLAKRDLRLVAEDNAIPAPEELSPTQSVEITARDGMLIHGYLTKSKFAAPSSAPLVLKLNAEPFATRFLATYDGEAQFFANRGYSVLALDYRGASGYGEKYEAAGRGEIAGKIIDDINDAEKWTIAQGYTTKGKICIYGEGISGGMALVAAAAEPDLVGCVVIKNSKTNWKQLSADRRTPFKAWYSVSEKTSKYDAPLKSFDKLTVPTLGIWRAENTLDPAIKSAFKKHKDLHVLAEFLDPHKFHEEFEYRSFDANHIAGFLDQYMSSK